MTRPLLGCKQLVNKIGSGPKNWVCEYWGADVSRWRLVDAQLDDFQMKTLGICLDPTDISRDDFLIAGTAWQQCRGGTDPNSFGIMDWFGLWFVRGNLLRDLLALSKVELLPWDTNAVIGPYENQDVDPQEYALLDTISEISITGDYSEVISFLRANKQLCMSDDWIA